MRSFDVIIAGGGHAGAEAAHAAARLGCSVALISMDITRIGQMSCNPAIGGLAKGQMVREIDALGGLMGRAIDAAGIQFRMLNRSKGPAVWGPRAQADKYKYAAEVQRLLRETPGVEIVQGEVGEVIVECGPSNVGETRHSIVHNQQSITGITLSTGESLACRALIITTGTFMRGLMHTGTQQSEGGRVGEASARTISDSLRALALELGRLKTGTPPRLHVDSIDFSQTEMQPGDEEPAPFSFLSEYAIVECGTLNVGASRQSTFDNPQSIPWRPPLAQVPCWITHTSPAVHAIIRDNLHLAPMFSGQIQSTGPRYCPSIEDKVHRFADKESHQIFLEPEGLDTPEIYCNGVSTSLPADVQTQLIKLIPGLGSARILRHGYAVEYDMVWPHQIRSTLETKVCRGLFLAGQINGTSGYEEAAGQGLIAGINAARFVQRGEADFVLRRDQAYIGVLIDDLVTKPPIEPYRMFTSRAEHRLSLRSDNADERLTPIGREIGLVDQSRFDAFTMRQEKLAALEVLAKQTRIDGVTLWEKLKRPDVTAHCLNEAETTTRMGQVDQSLARLLEIRAKYSGYIEREQRQVREMIHLEEKHIPTSLDYATVSGLRNEARTKLMHFTPANLGQALRISGITPADVSLLAVHLERHRRAAM